MSTLEDKCNTFNFFQVGDYNFSRKAYDEKILREKVKSYEDDKTLFDMYNKSLWEEIQEENNFFHELTQFRSILKRIHSFGRSIESQLVLPFYYEVFLINLDLFA